jgi:hypothetical protein
MGGIYEDKVRYNDVRAKFNKDWHKHSKFNRREILRPQAAWRSLKRALGN